MADKELNEESLGEVFQELAKHPRVKPVSIKTNDIIERTTALRWACKLEGKFGVKMVLQQGWVSHRTGKVEWRDIPQVGLDKEGNELPPGGGAWVDD